MYYVYIIQSLSFPEQIYVGCTENLNKRLFDHNSSHTPHTAKYKPWKIIVCINFVEKDVAYNFEKYLKSGSGRAFMHKRFLSSLKNVHTTRAFIPNSDLVKFIEIVNRRFGVYLDMMWGFKNNLERMNQVQNISNKMFNLSVDALDERMLFIGDEDPPISIELAHEKALHVRSQGQFKTDNSESGLNGVYAVYNCLSDVYNQWKIIKKANGVENDIPAMDYIGQLRDRAQHELYQENGLVQANNLVKIQVSLSSYVFPQFVDGDYILLTDKDCSALIKEIKLQLNTFLSVKNIEI